MAIKNSFSIKDLENLSGVKAHTIRIWEKRYNLLAPERTDSNIRSYDLNSLQKILNVALLNKNGIKISKIVDYTEEDLRNKVKEVSSDSSFNTLALNNFKMSMLNFDQHLFEKTFNKLLVTNSFRDVFLREFMALLTEIGNLWTTQTINPMHERFISTLIKQKILVNIERVQSNYEYENGGKVFVLFLPLNELHDIGLLYLHFELILKGYKSIFLGTSIPTEDLQEMQAIYKDITYVSYLTVEPNPSLIKHYLNDFERIILKKRDEKFHILGAMTKELSTIDISENIIIHDSLKELINYL